MELLIIFLSGWIAGSVYTTIKHIRNIQKIAEERGLDLEQMAQAVIENERRDIPIFVAEKENNIIYLYDKHNNSFIAQGNDFNELAKKTFELKIPVAMVVDGEHEFWFYKGELKDKAMV